MSLSKITEEIGGRPAPAGKVEKTASELLEYAREEVVLVGKEADDAAREARAGSLAANLEAAKKSVDGGAADKFEVSPYEAPAAPAPAAPGDGSAEKVAKACASLARAISGGQLRESVAKSGSAVVQQLEKAAAGGAQALLERVAAMFGVEVDPETNEYEGVSWKVQDAVCVIERAAKLERTMALLEAAFPGVAPAASVAKAAAGKRKEVVEDDESWPADLAFGQGKVHKAQAEDKTLATWGAKGS